VGCSKGPMTIPGLIVTRSISFSFADSQAAFSAKIFERTYQSWTRKNQTYNVSIFCLSSITYDTTWTGFNIIKGIPKLPVLWRNYRQPTLDFSQKSGSENQVSSTRSPDVRGFAIYETVAIEDVTTTLLIEETLAHDRKTLRVPFRAGSINSA